MWANVAINLSLVVVAGCCFGRQAETSWGGNRAQFSGTQCWQCGSSFADESGQEQLKSTAEISRLSAMLEVLLLWTCHYYHSTHCGREKSIVLLFVCWIKLWQSELVLMKAAWSCNGLRYNPMYTRFKRLKGFICVLVLCAWFKMDVARTCTDFGLFRRF